MSAPPGSIRYQPKGGYQMFFTYLMKVGRRGPFHTDLVIVPHRRDDDHGIGFNPKAVKAFTRRANHLNRSRKS